MAISTLFSRFWQKPSQLAPFYTAAIRALKQAPSSHDAFSSILMLNDDATSFTIKPHSFSFFSQTQKGLNLRTWQLFKQALIQEVGEKQFHHLCKRYGESIPYQKLERGAPFYIKYIKIFHVGLSQITSQQIGNLHSCSDKEITKKVSRVSEKLCGPLFSILEKTPLPASSYSALFQDQGKTIGSLFTLAKESEPIATSSLKPLSKSLAAALRSPFLPWLEIFCKRIVNREFLEGQLIPVPGKKGEIQWYKVYAKIAGCGLVAYALQPAVWNSSLPPLLVFRPTQTHAGAEDVLDTLRNDLDSSVGKSGWLATESAFEELMKDPLWRAPCEKIAVAGFSLGGAHMQYFLSRYVSSTSKAYSFNAPGVSEEAAKEFRAQVKYPALWSDPSPCELFIFRAEKDLVPLVGQVHVGWDLQTRKGAKVHVIQGVFQHISKHWIHAHRRDMLSDRECHLHEIEDPFAFHSSLHNGETPHWLYHVHNKTGWLISRALYLIVLVATTLEKLTTIRFLRPSLHYHWSDS